MDIEIDEIEQLGYAGSSSAKPTTGKPTIVPVDDAHPFDLDAYISGYSGRTAVDRLIHVIGVCPPLAPHAATLAARHIRSGRDPALLGTLQAAYELSQATAASLGGPELPPFSEVAAAVDARWVEEVAVKNEQERTRLEVELKTYTNNMIKESIRMAHRDLGNFFREIGEQTTSLRHYTKSREFCTTSNHVLDMTFSVLELLIEQRNYAHMATYVFKADSALDAAAASSKNAAAQSAAAATGAAAGAGAAPKKHGNAEREKVQSKLDFAAALSRLGQGHYERAAMAFLKIGPPKGLDGWVGKLLSPGDIAIYGTLCALASFTRTEVKARVLDNDMFGVYIEQEPYIRDLLDAYMSSKFKTVLELLEKFSTRHYADIHLATHVPTLTTLIRDRGLVLYFQPFASIRLQRMSQAFGWSVDDIEKAVVGLIQSGEIKGRVDSQSKILRAREADPRAELFTNAIKSGAEMQSATRKLLLRMRLQQADLVVKAPKGGQPSGGPGEFSMVE